MQQLDNFCSSALGRAAILRGDQRLRLLRTVFRNLDANTLFQKFAIPLPEVQQGFGTTHRFAELDVSTATPEGLVLLKLYAMPSLYRPGLFDRVSVDSQLCSRPDRLHRPGLRGLPCSAVKSGSSISRRPSARKCRKRARP
ncbi:MAG: hypothetical protein EXS31_01265 [Pedosphaera sp.]|nr:hypothetical protein [Pedosphaera sp.]